MNTFRVQLRSPSQLQCLRTFKGDTLNKLGYTAIALGVFREGVILMLLLLSLLKRESWREFRVHWIKIETFQVYLFRSNLDLFLLQQVPVDSLAELHLHYVFNSSL